MFPADFCVAGVVGSSENTMLFPFPFACPLGVSAFFHRILMVRDPQQRSVQASIACGCLFDCEFRLRHQFSRILQVSWWRLLLTAPMMSRMYTSKLCPMDTEKLFQPDPYHWLPCQGPVEFDAFLVGPSQGVD